MTLKIVLFGSENIGSHNHQSKSVLFIFLFGDTCLIRGSQKFTKNAEAKGIVDSQTDLPLAKYVRFLKLFVNHNQYQIS
jgi:hypothetical protein